MPVKNRFAELLPEITAWRRDFHEHPELLFDVHRTAGKVADLLRGFGCDEVVEGIGRTGVVGVIKGKTDTSGRVIGLRADMDALPIIETDRACPMPRRPPARCMPAAMTATPPCCWARRNTWPRRGISTAPPWCIFQPAEEGGGGGREMVQDGMMDRLGIQEVYGMHNMPGIPRRPFRHPPRRDDGGGRPVRDHGDRQGRPCRQAA